MKKNLLFACAVLVWLCPANSVFGSSMNHLVINQVQVEGDGGTNDEFIEIYNPTSSPASLNSWSLQYKSSSAVFSVTKKNFLADAVVPAGGYYLVAHKVDVVSGNGYNGSVTADHSHSSFSLSGSSSGATIFLVNSTSLLTSGTDPSIVDKLGYGSSSNNSSETANASLPASEQALLRSTDTDNNASDFTVAASNPRNASSVSSTPPPSPTPSPTPSPSPSPAPPPVPTYSSDIVISEFLVNPDGADTGEEWVELYNTSAGEVDLSSWKLDDESTTGSVGSSAYTLPENTAILGNGYLVINLPEGSFALNNTGGDTLRLIWPNNQVAGQVAYADAAPEDQTYARKPDSTWAWTTTVTKGTVNQFVVATPVPLSGEASDDLKIKINEIFSNPAGADSSKEWVEFRNTGLVPVSLHGWILDDGEISEKIGSSAYVIQSPVIGPGELAVVVIPSGKFALDNSGTETVRVFNASKVLIDSVTYDGAKEDLSYAYDSEGKWQWVKPTPNIPNLAETLEAPKAEVNVIINEIFPEPAKGEEFIELKNLGLETADLTGWTLSDNVGSYTLDLKLEPQAIKVVKKSQSKLSLNNYGKETVSLTDPDGNIAAEVEYEDPPKNQSYNYISGDYVWSSAITPGKENQYQKPVLKTVKKSSVKKSATTVSSGPELSLELQNLMQDEANVQQDTQTFNTGQVAGAATSVEPSVDPSTNKNSLSFFAGGLLAGIAIAGAFCYIGFNLGKKEGHI